MILKRGVSGKLCAALTETSPTTAAGTSLLTSRLIAVVWPLLSSTWSAPAAAIAVLTRLIDCSEYRSSIAIVLPARSETDLTSGPATRTATSASSNASNVGTDIRSAAAEAAATCSCVVRVCGTSAVVCGSAVLARAASEVRAASAAAALPIVCWFACGEGAGMGTAAADFAATLMGLGVRRTAWCARDRGGLSPRQVASDTRSAVAESAACDSGSIGTWTAVRQANGFRPTHDGCVGCWLLQPARVVASAQTRSVLNRSS